MNLAIVVGRGIGWLITVMIANMFNKCSKKASRSSSLFKEGGRRENGRENRQEQEEPIEMTAMTGTPRAKMVDEDLAGDDVDVYLEKKVNFVMKISLSLSFLNTVITG